VTGRRTRRRATWQMWGLSIQGELLVKKLVANIVEGGKRHKALNESLHMVIVPTETTQKVEDKRAVGDRLARSRKESVMPFIRRQYSVMERSLGRTVKRHRGGRYGHPSCRETRPRGQPRHGEGCPALTDDILKLDSEYAEHP
jgi:hypothetical protein